MFPDSNVANKINIFYSNYGLLQGEVSKASDIACATYYENTEKPTGHGVWRAMETAVQKCIKTIRGKNFDKLVAVANPAHGDAFEKEVH